MSGLIACCLKMSLIRKHEFFHHEDERSSEVNCVFIHCILNESRRVAIGLFDLGGRPNWKMLPVKKGTACWVGPSL